MKNSKFRRMALSFLRRFNPGDVTIKHHWFPAKKLRIHSFKHKGYWWHGKNREQKTIDSFFRVIGEGETVIEVGGHIGYLSIIFSSLIGDNGKLYVFEPGENNLAYTERNLNSLSNTSLIKKAVSNTNGTVELFLEDLTGQNNSIVEKYHQFENNVKNSGVNDVKIYSKTIPCITLDKFVQESIEGKISFIKIDIEGAELLALQGATNILKNHGPGLMVEITAGSREVFELLTSSGYKLFTPAGEKITDPEQISGNTFCWKTDNEIEKFFLDETRSHT